VSFVVLCVVTCHELSRQWELMGTPSSVSCMIMSCDCDVMSVVFGVCTRLVCTLCTLAHRVYSRIRGLASVSCVSFHCDRRYSVLNIQLYILLLPACLIHQLYTTTHCSVLSLTDTNNIRLPLTERERERERTLSNPVLVNFQLLVSVALLVARRLAIGRLWWVRSPLTQCVSQC